ncbi:uncharacterized protein LOC116220850 [Clupea harengus]|uniref:Uncharacterized protein LOC116220850 n=1 Tax=Clupea harengus TaxID=7950 RepID=A0A8M1KIK2_CLUHA|nr:uncharacterized protein LOC116220850 [Clupea harengus]
MQCFDFYIMKLTHMLYPHTFLDKAQDIIQLNQVTEAEPGDTVTLDCFFHAAFENEALSWYKLSLGRKPFWVARSYRGISSWNPLFSEDSQNGRMNIQRSKGTFNLTIAKITSSDEAAYYCIGTAYQVVTFGNGTFLALKGHRQFNHSFNEDRAFFCAVANCGQMNTEKKKVLNTEKAVDPVVYGLAAVSGLCFVLICYLIYQDRRHKHDKGMLSVIIAIRMHYMSMFQRAYNEVQTETRTEDLRVFWFRPASGDSHPGVIYTNNSRGGQCEGRCVYSLSKKDINISDAGTYYCGIATSRQILFSVVFCCFSEKAVDPVVFGLAAVSGLCFMLICYLIYQDRKHKHDKEVKSQQVHTDRSVRDPSSGQDAEEPINYAALHFSDKKLKRGKKKRDLPRESIYSDVRG